MHQTQMEVRDLVFVTDEQASQQRENDKSTAKRTTQTQPIKEPRARGKVELTGYLAGGGAGAREEETGEEEEEEGREGGRKSGSRVRCQSVRAFRRADHHRGFQTAQ